MISTLCAFAIIQMAIFGQVNTEVSNQYEDEQHRAFDFWIGEWDVNLRMIQEDLSWKDAVSSTARIYRILDGRAILELWNENKFGQGIKGYSIRYYNEEKQKWELWLNWPGADRSGSSSLEGNFRHGRGDFYSERPVNDSTMMISRYSFNDITPKSLRWDDAYSKDGGKTWTNNWIMEFSRKRDLGPLFRHDQPLLTYDEGRRCSLPQFSHYDQLSGEWKGKVKFIKSGEEVPVQLEVYRVLDGCAVISFMDSSKNGKIHKSFSLKTYNTYANTYEESVLTNHADQPLKMYYGSGSKDSINTVWRHGDATNPQSEKNEWSFDGSTITWRYYIKEEAEWTLEKEAVFRRI